MNIKREVDDINFTMLMVAGYATSLGIFIKKTALEKEYELLCFYKKSLVKEFNVHLKRLNDAQRKLNGLSTDSEYTQRFMAFAK